MSNVWMINADRLVAAYKRAASPLRFELVTRALLEALAPAPGRILDVGGGYGVQAIRLARSGYDVTVLDPDAAMLAEAERRLADEPKPVRGRVRLVLGAGEHLARLVGGGFDAICCHSVLMYVEDPRPLLEAVVSATRPGGLVSILTVNPQAAAMRAGLQQRWHDAVMSLRAGRNRDSRVVTTHTHDLSTVTEMLDALGAPVFSWHGVGVFTDHLPKQDPAETTAHQVEGLADGVDGALNPLEPQLVEAEWLAGTLDPYRQVARSAHLLARRRR